MVVDDNQEFLTEMTEVLESSGYETIPILDSRFAVMVACRRNPDVLLLDLKMEGVSGFEIAYRLRRLPKTMYTPIICMTGYYTQEEHKFLFRICTVKECLTKPFNPLDIITAIERAVKVKEPPKEL